jgi:site-specific DNA-methyltransferase (adenine-specific)
VIDDVRAVLDGSARWAVVCGDSGEVLPTLPAACAAALVTDPPAGIAFMQAEWDDFRRARNPADAGRDSVGGRFSRSAPEVGRGDRERFVTWLAGILGAARACVVPGGRSLVWSIPRTSHWTGCAVEDAGWSIETEINHLFGQGWPKGKSQLKPAHEGWKLARNGPTQPLNIDDCRVTTGGPSPSVERREIARRTGTTPGHPGEQRHSITNRISPERYMEERPGEQLGRWPATVELSHTPWCQCVGSKRVRASAPHGPNAGNGALGQLNDDGWQPKARSPQDYGDPDGLETVAAWQCVEGCPVLALDRESGELSSNSGRAFKRDGVGYMGGASGGETQGYYGDTGTASRFFAQHPAVDPDEPDPFVYATKVPAAERWCLARCGCGERVMLLDVARETCAAVDGKAVGEGEDEGRVQALRCTVCGLTRVHIVHPTQKSVALMRRFVRLLSKPGDVILDCFGGSFTTGVAALLEGRRFVGIEKDPHFAAIGRARLDAVAPTRATLARVAVEAITPKATPHHDLPLLRGLR